MHDMGYLSQVGTATAVHSGRRWRRDAGVQELRAKDPHAGAQGTALQPLRDRRAQEHEVVGQTRPPIRPATSCCTTGARAMRSRRRSCTTARRSRSCGVIDGLNKLTPERGHAAARVPVFAMRRIREGAYHPSSRGGGNNGIDGGRCGARAGRDRADGQRQSLVGERGGAVRLVQEQPDAGPDHHRQLCGRARRQRAAGRRLGGHQSQCRLQGHGRLPHRQPPRSSSSAASTFPRAPRRAASARPASPVRSTCCCRSSTSRSIRRTSPRSRSGPSIAAARRPRCRTTSAAASST